MNGIIDNVFRFYKLALSPFLAPCCRFEPECSTYVRDALKQHGLLRGAVLGFWRILRCQPYCRGGFDPVPTKADVHGR
ncbi:MAG: membrane protein insertion efficiency factor YidD [Oligoflexia bacterium]|nr:membrane protein insertion efficiency factor YidD [Oligoflexia bacterium]